MVLSREVLELGRERVRARTWRGNDHVVELSPVPDGPLPSSRFVRHCLEMLAERGCTEVVTGALLPIEQSGFVGAGFELREELHLLARHLRDLPPPEPAEGLLRRARRGDRPAVLALDQISFRSFWRFDPSGLDDALSATPATRFRVAPDGHGAGALAGYAISGRAARRGYVQRLAVHPEHRRMGLGRALVLDALRWMRRWAVERVVVNTQLDNDAALALYLRLGFVLEPHRLAVLTRRLER